MAVAADDALGRVYTLTSTGCSITRPDLVAYTTSGKHEWTALGTGTQDVQKYVAVDPVSHDIVTAGVRNEKDLLVQAWSSSGAHLWGKTLGATNSTVTVDGLAIDDGKVFVGSTIDKDGDGDFLTAAYDVTTGASLWHTRWDDGVNGNDGLGSLAVDTGLHLVFVTGDDMPDDAVITIAYRESDGTETAGAGQSGGLRPIASAVDSGNHHVYVLADTEDGTVRVLEYGRLLASPNWTVDFAGTADAGSVSGDRLAIDAGTHRIYLSATEDEQQHAVVAAVSPAGTIVWSDADTTASSVLLEGLAVDPTGSRVYVTGTSFVSPTVAHQVTWADTTTGRRAWHSVRAAASVTRTGGLAADFPSSRLYVVSTGGAIGSAAAMTLAYAS